MRVPRQAAWLAAVALCAVTGISARAQTTPGSAEIDACRASGLIALKQRSPSVKSIEIDPDTVSVSTTDTTIEQTAVRTIVLGLATIETAKKEKPNQFVCLIGDKGKVLLTFFTQK